MCGVGLMLENKRQLERRVARSNNNEYYKTDRKVGWWLEGLWICIEYFALDKIFGKNKSNH